MAPRGASSCRFRRDRLRFGDGQSMPCHLVRRCFGSISPAGRRCATAHQEHRHDIDASRQRHRPRAAVFTVAAQAPTGRASFVEVGTSGEPPRTVAADDEAGSHARSLMLKGATRRGTPANARNVDPGGAQPRRVPRHRCGGCQGAGSPVSVSQVGRVRRPSDDRRIGPGVRGRVAMRGGLPTLPSRARRAKGTLLDPESAAPLPSSARRGPVRRRHGHPGVQHAAGARRGSRRIGAGFRGFVGRIRARPQPRRDDAPHAPGAPAGASRVAGRRPASHLPLRERHRHAAARGRRRADLRRRPRAGPHRTDPRGARAPPGPRDFLPDR